MLIPSALRSMLRSARQRLSSLLRVNTFMLEGVEKVSGEGIRIFFAGIAPDSEYLGHMSLREGFTITVLGRCFVWTALIKRKAPDCDIQIVTAHRFLSRYLMWGEGFHIPRWIGTEVNLSVAKQLAESSKSLKWDMRKVTRNGYRYEIARDRTSYDYFYERMYLPYIDNIYGNRSFLMSYDVMMSELDNCELGFVKKGEQCLAGGIIICKDNKVRGWSLGVLDGDQALVKEGVITALYYFETLYLLEKGVQKRSFGSSRAFLRDGVLKFKKKWGIRITSAKPFGFCLKPLGNSAASSAFLQNNPFIFEKNGAFHAGVFVAADFAGDFAAWAGRTYKDYYCNGIDKLYIFYPEGMQPGDLAELDIAENIELKPYDSVF